MDVGRRQVLTWAGLTVAVATVGVASGEAPATASAGPRLELVPVADDPVPVLAGDGGAPCLYPRHLAVRVEGSQASLPAGTRISVSYDPRVYVPLPAPVARVDGVPVRAMSNTLDEANGLVTCLLTVQDPVPARGAGAGSLVVVVATAGASRYPRDLITGPGAALVRATAVGPAARSGSPRAADPLELGGRRVAAQASEPWGTAVSGVWEEVVWGANDELRYHYPVRVMLHGIGPGRAPVPAAFVVRLDPQVIREVTVRSATMNRTSRVDFRRSRWSRTAGVHETRWSSSVRLGAGDVLEVRLEVTAAPPAGPLQGITHPVVALDAAVRDAGRRVTDLEELTRHDAVWS